MGDGTVRQEIAVVRALVENTTTLVRGLGGEIIAVGFLSGIHSG